MDGTTLRDVKIEGSFDGINIEVTDFPGSKEAKIDPQTVKDRNLDGTTLRDVKIEGSFDGINTSNTNSYDNNMEVKSVIDNILNSLAKVEEAEHQSKDNSAVQKIKK